VNSWASMLSIRAKVMLLSILTSSLALIVAGAVLGWNDYRDGQRALLDHLRTQASVTALHSAAAVAFDDRDAARRTLAALSADGEIAAAEIRGRDGTVLAQSGFNRGTVSVLPPVSADIVFGETIGVISLWGSTSRIEAGLRAEVRLLIGALAGALVLAMLAASFLERMISKPVAELARAKRQLEAALGDAQAATRAKADFLANMSHEIRTPMNGVIGMLDLMHAEPLGPEPRSMLETARSSADSLLTLINDVLDFSKIDAGKLTLERIDVDLRPLVEDVATLFSKQANGKGIELTCAVHNDVPEIVMGDPTRMRQIMANLVGNAVKFTERGEVFLGVRLRERSVGAANAGAAREEGVLWVQIIVQDTGIGMEESAIGKLFHVFSQADGSTTRKYGGTGLGLAITRKLVDAMGGSVLVKSEPNKGSIFSVLLPLAAGTREQRIRDGSLQSVKVLIVDDNPTNRCILEHYLQHEGIQYESAPSARTGLEAARLAAGGQKPFDLVLLDYQMPEMDGVGFLAELRSDALLARTPCIVLSSLGDRVTEAAPVAAWLTKPVRRFQLRHVLTSVLGRTAPTPEYRPAVVDQSALHRGARVLLVEDNKVNQEVASRMLKSLGIEPVMAAEGALAVAAVRQQRFDLVLMDCQMPVMDGYEATAAIRAWEAAADPSLQGTRLPIVAMTANALPGDREKCLAAGMDDYISKPIKREAVTAALSRWLRMDTTAQASIVQLRQTTVEDAYSAASGAALDITALIQLRDMMEEDFIQVIEAYLADTPARLTDIFDGIAGHDPELVGRAAHSLKSTSQTVGAVMLARAAERLEEHVRVGSALADAEGLLTAAQLAWQAVGVQLSDLVARQRVPGEAGVGIFIKEALKSAS
jgi:signal transduction histidine kinase/DNA-binding response OmpR family regulator